MGNLPPGQWTWGIDVIVSFDYLDKHWFRFISYSKNKGEVLENMRYSYASEQNDSIKAHLIKVYVSELEKWLQICTRGEK